MRSVSAPAPYGPQPSTVDPFAYQPGFGNRFASEALPDVLPRGLNCPQKVKYDLYSEQLNGSGFVSPRAQLHNVWMYRIRPAVAHGLLRPQPDMNPLIESAFTRQNPKVAFHPSQEAWNPFPLPPPSTPTDFVQGIRSIAGQGDPCLKDGLAVHIYAANTSMQRRAFCNNDGDMLILPQQGRLHLQTELGHLMVRPGELVVVPAGIRFRVALPDEDSVRGYILELFGQHFTLPELGPIGSNGMALPRDFLAPVASFDMETETEAEGESKQKPQWTIVYKMTGGLFSCTQNHTPFDVVAWHGNLTPYKYALEDFVNLANAAKDQADPTIYCVLTAPSRTPGQSLIDFLVFTPKWIATDNAFRPPYYHRNMSAEVMGLIYGVYGGSSHVLEPGGLSYEAAYMPHGETYDTWRTATQMNLQPTRVCEGTMAFMFHIGVPLSLTDWAVEVEVRNKPDEAMWADVKAHFFEHMDEVKRDLEAAGRKW